MQWCAEVDDNDENPNVFQINATAITTQCAAPDWHFGFVKGGVKDDGHNNVELVIPTLFDNPFPIPKTDYSTMWQDPNKLRLASCVHHFVWDCTIVRDDGTTQDAEIGCICEDECTFLDEHVEYTLPFSQVKPRGVTLIDFGDDDSADGDPPSIDENLKESSPEQPNVSPVNVDADFQDCPPTGEVRSGMKRKRTGAQRAAKTAALKALSEDGGYTDKGRLVYRQEGGILVTGSERTCLPDALFHLLVSRSLMSGTSEERNDLLSIMPPAGSTHDTLFTTADAYVRLTFNLRLRRVTAVFNSQKGGPEVAILRSAGFFIIQLRITYDKDDKQPDLHCVAYDGVEIKDNARTAKVKIIEDVDRASTEGARKVFNSLFRHGLLVRIKNIYELAPVW